MLEIMGLILLINTNKKNAMDRGRKPGGFVGLTVGLWIGLEILGIVIGLSAGLGLVTYVLAIVMAAIGGLISFLVAKNCKQGDFIPPAQQFMQDMAGNTEPLAYPANITIVRESSMVSSLVSWTFSLNGRHIGSLGNGKAMMVSTNQRQNILVAVDSYGSELPPFTFDVEAGAQAQIFFKINRFLPEKSIGLLTPSMPRQAQYAAAPPYLSGNVQGVQTSFCHKCGTPFEEGETFCAECGTQRFVPPPAEASTWQPRDESVRTAIPLKRETAPVEAKPIRAFWVAVWLVAAYIIIFLFQRFTSGRIQYCYSVASLIVDVLFGTSIYLYMHKGVKAKLLAAGATFAGLLLSVVHQLYPYIPPHPLEMQTNTFPLSAIAGILLSAISTAGGALLFSHLLKDTAQNKPAYNFNVNGTPSSALDKSKVWRVALFTALVSMLANVLLVVITRSSLFKLPNFLTQFVFSNIFAALTLVLTPPALHALSTMKTKRIRLSAWGYVWCSLCTFGMLISIMIVILTPPSRFTFMYSSQLFMSIAALTGFIMLMARRRLGWYVILFSTSIALMGQFEEAFIHAVILGHTPYIGHLISSILGALNPLITWFSIRSAWNAEDVPIVTKVYNY